MALTAGTRVGPYDILSALGAGGMGEVYRAHDTKLKRDVALKILPESFASDPDRLARFQREAQVLASLNHPNIAHIHGLEESNGIRALVMELVEGEDLAQRSARGPIPLDEALPIAKQIADALEAAHEQGVIHRDLKPANIKVRPDGMVKVLDFGLAKAMEPTSAISLNVSMSPTITTPAMTQAGIILGTAAYMSPEQTKGRPVDKRSDLWAFGAVVYEMLTGARAFRGEDVSDTLAFILTREPDWAALPANMPLPIRRLLRRCMEKDRTRRMADAADARLEIEEALSAPAVADWAAPSSVPRPLWRRAVPVVAAAVVAGAAVGAAAWMLTPTPRVEVTRFAFALGEGQRITTPSHQVVAISPDGSRLVYIANNQLYLRSLSDLEARPIQGTQERVPIFNPIFSPDGQSIAFVSRGDGATGVIRKIAVGGGAAVTVCPVDNAQRVMGMTWDASGIVFGQTNGITRVSENGGQPELLVSAKGGEFMHGPQVLPGGEWLLFTLATTLTPDGWDRAQIVAQSLKSGERKTLVAGGTDGRYLLTGHLVYAVGGVVFAVPFDLRRIAVTGGPVPIIEGVQRGQGDSGTARFSVSGTRHLVFIPGPVSGTTIQRSIAWIDRQGGLELLKIPPGYYQLPRLSPDGTRLAFGSDDGKDANLWIYELAGSSAMRRLTVAGRHNRFPVWSADSQRVAFQSDREGDLGIFWQRADGTGTAERLTTAEEGVAHIPEAWAPDGAHFLYNYNAGKGGATSLWVFSDPTRGCTRYASPHNRASRLARLYQAMPPIRMPSSTGVFPGMTDSGPNFERPFDISRDGLRFLVAVNLVETQVGASAAPQIQVVLNWSEELKQRAPTR